jgi:prepilin-type N-terminal cleavage/methylation domain-containing protein/prepilin-type processing-associated H-X9-DG protein
MLATFQGMRAIRYRSGPKAFTLIELLCVMALIGILASLLLPVINQARARAKRIACLNNLREVGVAFQGFAHDHNGQFPMSVPAIAGGSQEFTTTSYQVAGEFYFSFRHFQALSNDLVTPKLLACPADTRLPVPSFASFDNDHLSYFVGLCVDYSLPGSVLAGDRNLTNDHAGFSTLVLLQPKGGWRWSSEMHQFKGNVLYADGHVEEKNSQALAAGLDQAPFVAHLSLPSLPRSLSIGTSYSNPGQNVQRLPAYNPPSDASKPSSLASQIIQSRPVSVLPWASPPSLASSDDSTITDTKPQTKSARSASGPTKKPGANDEPGFSFFPPSIGNSLVRFARSSAWGFYLLLLLFTAIALFLRIRPGSQKRQSTTQNLEVEDAE